MNNTKREVSESKINSNISEMTLTKELKKPVKRKNARGMVDNVLEQFNSASDQIGLHPNIRNENPFFYADVSTFEAFFRKNQ